MNATSQFRS